MEHDKFDDLIIKFAQKFKVPPAQVKGHIMQESEFDPMAIGKIGEKGLMQLRESTAKEMGWDEHKEDLFDPEINIHLGTKYIAWLYEELGHNERDKVIAAYNWGIGNVWDRKPMPWRVRWYVSEVKRYALAYHLGLRLKMAVPNVNAERILRRFKAMNSGFVSEGNEVWLGADEREYLTILQENALLRLDANYV